MINLGSLFDPLARRVPESNQRLPNPFAEFVFTCINRGCHF